MVEQDLLYAYQGLKGCDRGRRVGGGPPPDVYSRGKQLTLRRGHGGQDQGTGPAGTKADKDLSGGVRRTTPSSLMRQAGTDGPQAETRVRGSQESGGDPIQLLKSRPTRLSGQIQECIDAGLVLEYKDGDYPLHCSPCFLVANLGLQPNGW